MSKLRIGIVGCGAIGSSLAKVIVKDFSRQALLGGLYDLDRDKTKKLSLSLLGTNRLSRKSLKELLKNSELIIESASAKDSWDIAKLALANGKDIMIMSVGGVLGRLKPLTVLAKQQKAKIYIPSGAISGLDALKAAAIAKINKVLLTTTKHPLSFKGVKYVEEKKINLAGIKKDRVLFSGRARDAVKYFPQNINVAAVLSLAGIGENKTLVKIIASPRAARNMHEIRITSDAGDIFTRTENIVHPDNPKTSYLAVLSAVAVLKQILQPVKIGT